MAKNDAPACVLVTIGDWNYVLPVEDVASLTAMLPAMARAERVQFDWTNKCYKPYTTGGQGDPFFSIRPFTAKDMAILRLETTAE